MKTVNVTEFRSNIKRYLEIAQKEKLIIHRSKGTSFVLVPIDEMNEDDILYPELQKKIDQARKEKEDGTLKRLTPELKKQLFKSIL